MMRQDRHLTNVVPSTVCASRSVFGARWTMATGAASVAISPAIVGVWPDSCHRGTSVGVEAEGVQD